MNRKVVVIALVVIAAAVAFALTRQSSHAPAPQAREPVAQRPATTTPQHSHAAEAVPAHYETTPSAGSLPPTLPLENFRGLIRDAYKAVGEMPQTIAQLPCYCHCDEGFGHKSLQSCFVDDHAAHCDICVKEAVLRKIYSDAAGHRRFFLRRRSGRAKRRTSPVPSHRFRLTF